MQIKKTVHDGINDCYEIAEGNKKLVITAGFGPRIIHLSAGDSGNIFFHDTKKAISYKDWFIYGGHRFWTSPETNDSYSPDNIPCTVNQDRDSITVAHFDAALGIEKRMTVACRDERFYITHTLVNKGIFLVQASLWGLTCVAPRGTVFFPWGVPAREWETKKIIYWKKWGDVHASTIGSKQYIQGDDLFIIKPSGEEGKVGTGGHEGFIGVTDTKYTFIKKAKRIPGAVYPDDNCAVECYTCDKFIELETLSPVFTIAPQTEEKHCEEWIVLDRGVDPMKGQEIRALL